MSSEPFRRATLGLGGNIGNPARAMAEDVEGGARLLLAPVDASQQEALRAHVQKHVQAMNQGACPMGVMSGGEASVEHPTGG